MFKQTLELPKIIIAGDAAMKFFRDLLRSRKGATAIEYALIAALISLSIVAASQGLGGQLKSTFEKSSSGFNG